MRETIFTMHDLSQTAVKPNDKMYAVIAYVVHTDNMSQHFLRLCDSKIVNPNELSLRELKRDYNNFTKVTEEVYNKYHDILHGRTRTGFQSLERMMS